MLKSELGYILFLLSVWLQSIVQNAVFVGMQSQYCFFLIFDTFGAGMSVDKFPNIANAVDTDPQETKEWLEALQAVIEHEGEERAHFLLEFN